MAQKRSFTSTSTNVVTKKFIVGGTTISKPGTVVNDDTENIPPNLKNYFESFEGQPLGNENEAYAPPYGSEMSVPPEDDEVGEPAITYELEALPINDDEDGERPIDNREDETREHAPFNIQQEFAKLNLKLDALLKWTGKSGTSKLKYNVPIQTSEELLEWNSDISDHDVFQSSVSLYPMFF